jgi:hypothetical protein
MNRSRLNPKLLDAKLLDPELRDLKLLSPELLSPELLSPELLIEMRLLGWDTDGCWDGLRRICRSDLRRCNGRDRTCHAERNGHLERFR